MVIFIPCTSLGTWYQQSVCEFKGSAPWLLVLLATLAGMLVTRLLVDYCYPWQCTTQHCWIDLYPSRGSRPSIANLGDQLIVKPFTTCIQLKTQHVLGYLDMASSAAFWNSCWHANRQQSNHWHALRTRNLHWNHLCPFWCPPLGRTITNDLNWNRTRISTSGCVGHKYHSWTRAPFCWRSYIFLEHMGWAETVCQQGPTSRSKRQKPPSEGYGDRFLSVVCHRCRHSFMAAPVATRLFCPLRCQALDCLGPWSPENHRTLLLDTCYWGTRIHIAKILLDGLWWVVRLPEASAPGSWSMKVVQTSYNHGQLAGDICVLLIIGCIHCFMAALWAWLHGWIAANFTMQQYRRNDKLQLYILDWGRQASMISKLNECCPFFHRKMHTFPKPRKLRYLVYIGSFSTILLPKVLSCKNPFPTEGVKPPSRRRSFCSFFTRKNVRFPKTSWIKVLGIHLVLFGISPYWRGLSPFP